MPTPAVAAAAALAILAIAGQGCGPGDLTRTETIELPGGGRSDGGGEELATDRCEDHDLEPAEGNLDRVEAAALCLVDAERRDRGLAELRRDDDLTDAARAKSQDMVERRYFDHVGPDGRDVADWVGDTGYLPSAGYKLGENLGWGSDGAASAAVLVRGWMGSAGHRRNILREDFEDTGMGVVLGAPDPDRGGGATFTQMFGAR